VSSIAKPSGVLVYESWDFGICYTCVLIPAIHVSSYLLYTCPHTFYMRVLIPEGMGTLPNDLRSLRSSYICSYICDYICVWQCSHTCSACDSMCPQCSHTCSTCDYIFVLSVRIPALHATKCVLSVRIPSLHATLYVSSVFAYLLYMRLYMCPQCSHTCSTCDYICVLILLTIHVQERAEICCPSSYVRM
jgi:hypothetical protein